MNRKTESIVVRGCGSTLRFKGKRVRDNDDSIYSDFYGWRELRARRLIRGVWGRKGKSDSPYLRVPGYKMSINWGIRVYVTSP